jgi:hypothetical protein
MAKYRLLTLDELQALEKEFINYLILNGIDASEWEKLKKEDKSAAEKVVELFSDVVFEKIFRKVEYLEQRSAKDIRCFQCLQDKLVIVGIKAPTGSKANFNDPEYISLVMKNPTEEFDVYTSEKVYAKQREVELFEMTQAGCTISDSKLFKAICLIFPY